MAAGDSISSQQLTETVGAPQPSKKQQAAARRAAAAKEHTNAVRRARSRRNRWEASPEGRERLRDINDLAGSDYRDELAKRGMSTESGAVERTGRSSMSKSQLYGGMGVRFEGHGYGDQQLPGLENRHAAPEPERWEDRSVRKRANTRSNLAEAGTNIQQMASDFGAQLDQSLYRAYRARNLSAADDRPVPFTQHFYDTHPGDTPSDADEPKELMREAAHRTGRTLHEMTAATALTSPNTKFTARNPKTGQRYSPNVETAESAISQYQSGVAPEHVGLGRSPRGGSNQGYPANSQKVARLMQHIDAGGRMGDYKNPPTKSEPKGKSPFGLKTGPFVNAFDSEHPDFFVNDVHSGGGGFLPHLSAEKPVKVGADGQPKLKNGKPDRDKSEREKVIEGAGFHSAGDYAARLAMSQRGMGTVTHSGRILNVSTRQPQADQWGEEQIARGIVKPHDAYPHLNRQQFPQHPGQGSLF